MKKLYAIMMIMGFVTGVYAQELDSLMNIVNKNEAPQEVKSPEEPSDNSAIIIDSGNETNVKILDKDVVKVIDNGDTTKVEVGAKGVLQVIDQPDSTRIRVGDREISIVERGDDTDIKWNKFKNDDEDKDESGRRKFRGHWAGLEWGLNNFLDEDLTLSREENAAFMDLNTDRSWAFDLNFAQYSLGFGSPYFGLVTGLGLSFNNYFFDGKNNIIERNDSVVINPLSGDISKSKLTTSFLRIPLILEAQFPRTIRSKRVFISAGLVAGLKLGSHSKVVYKVDGGKKKDKNNDDFNINPFRYGLTARVGYGSLSVFADYYLTPLFIADKGPELHPFTVGLALAF
jgi:hypothetical protein